MMGEILDSSGKYTNLGVADQNAADGEPLYDGFQTTWVKEEIDLSDYLGSTIIVSLKSFLINMLTRKDTFLMILRSML